MSRPEPYRDSTPQNPNAQNPNAQNPNPQNPAVERVSLDQLFAAGEERPKRRVPGPVRDLIVAVVLGGGIYAVLRVMTLVVPIVILICSVYTIMLLRRAVTRIGPVPAPPALVSPAWGVAEDDGQLTQVDGVVRVVRRWETRFGWTERDHVRFSSAVLPRLVEVVEERLRYRHGVSLYADPERARDLLGERLWTFLTTPVRRSPAPAELALLVAEMEKI